jgi:MerR family transcriptional regulator/heat shock protein HspR
MSRPIIPRDLVSRELAISPQILVRYERLGFVQVTREGQVEGYEPAQVRRLWTIMSFQRDLGINIAGVEVILRLHDRMCELHDRLDHLASELREMVQDESGSQANSGAEAAERRDSHV